MQHDDLDLFREFKVKNNDITSNLLKRGLIINALKEGKTKSEAISCAKISEDEFNEIYQTSRIEKTDFYLRFNLEYCENRKRQYVKHLKTNDFYNAIVKSDMSQKEFNKWYAYDESRVLGGERASDFYINTTKLLMDKYIESRRSGKNKPDSARCVGLSNLTIDKWMKHQEISIFRKFKNNIRKMHLDLIVSAFNEAKSKKDVKQIHDIPIKTIDIYINNGRNGISEYAELFNAYRDIVVPNQIEIFLRDIKTKPFKKALKNSKFTKKELNYFYNLGKNGDELYKEFYEKYLDLKIRLYVDSILAKKSQKIALKNSHLTGGEFSEMEDKINDLLFEGRMDIIYDTLMQNKHSAAQLSASSGVSVEELYEWYFKGLDGDEKFKEYHLLFELSIISPRVIAINKALSLGIPRNKLMKRLKEDIGSKDFKIWQKYGIIENQKEKLIDLSEENIDRERILNIVNNSASVKRFYSGGDPEMFELIKKAIRGNTKISASYLDISGKQEENQKIKDEILGK